MPIKKTLEFETREVSWKVLGLNVSDTLTIPIDDRPHSAIVLVAGSGPTDRNWCSPLLPGANGSGKLLAEVLSNRGFITIRYDKLASGPNARNNMETFKGKLSMNTHLEELSGAVDTLISECSGRINDLFVIANSEGSIHAVNYQLEIDKNKFKGLVLTSPPGRPIGTVARDQLIRQVSAIPASKTIMEHYDQVIQNFVNGVAITVDDIFPEPLRPLLKALDNPYNLPFSRELWVYNLADYLKKIEEPVLIVIGKKDIQIDWKLDGGALETAVRRKKNVEFYYPENCNHILKHEEKPKGEIDAQYVTINYNKDGTELDMETVEHIIHWLRKMEQQ